MRLDQDRDPFVNQPHGSNQDPAFLERVLDSIPNAVFVKNVEGHYVYCNEVASEFISTPLQKIVGSHAQDVFGVGLSNELRKQDETVLKSGKEQTGDFLVPIESGNRIFSVTKSPFRDPSGNVVGLLGVVQNITAQREAERTLRQQNAILEMVATGKPLQEILDFVTATIEREVSHCSCGILIVDRDRHHWRVGSYGSTPHSILHQWIDDVESSRAQKNPIVGLSLDKDRLRETDLNKCHSLFENGEKLSQSVNFLLHPVRTDPGHRSNEGEVTAQFVVLLNSMDAKEEMALQAICRLENLVRIVLENHWNHAELKANETRFRHFVNNTTDAFFMFDDTATIVDVSNKACEYLGFDREELVGSKPNLFSPFMNLNRFQHVLKELSEGEHLSFETIHQRKDGVQIPVDVRLVHFNADDRVYAMATVRDISVQKRDEAKLRESQGFAEAIIEASPECIKLVDREGLLREMNASGLKMIEANHPQDVIGQSVFDIIAPEFRQLFILFHERVCQGIPGSLEFEIIGRNGTRRSVESNAVAVDIQGERMHLAATRDVTARKQVEQELRKSTSIIQRLVSGTTDAIFVKDLNGKYLLFNEAASRFVGKPIDSVIGQDDRALFDSEDAKQIMERDQHVIASGTVSTAEEILFSDGITRTFLATKGPFFDETGRVAGVFGISRDITTRKATERELALAQFSVDNISDSIFWIGEDGVVVNVNQGACSRLGYLRVELVGRHFSEVDSFPSASRWQEIWEVLQRQGTFGLETRFRTREGGDVEVEMRVTLLRYEDQHIAFAIATDITAKKEAARTLEMKQFTVDSASDSIFWMGVDGVLIDVNEGACRRLGYEHEELIGKRMMDIDADYSNSEVLRLWQSLEWLRTFSTETRHRTKTGQLIDVEVRASLFDFAGRSLVCVFASDISSRKQSERSIATQHAITSILSDAGSLEIAAPGILQAICEGKRWGHSELWMVDAEHQSLRLLNSLDHSRGAPQDFWISQRKTELKIGEGLPGRVWELGRVVELEPGSYESMLLGVPFDPEGRQSNSAVGVPIAFGKEFFGVALFFSDGSRDPISSDLESLGMQIGQFIDRKRTEAKLRLFRTLIDQTSDFIELVDPETYRFIDVNQTACCAHGYSREEYLSRTVCDLVFKPSMILSLQEVMEELRAKGSTIVERVHVRKDGTMFPVEVNINLIQLEREYMVAVVRDVTERKRMEEQLRESQKLDAIGRLAGGLAHDFNNLLTIINCHTELLLLTTTDEDPMHDHYLAIQHAGTRAAELIAQLLAFSRKSIFDPRAVNLNTVVEEATHLITGFVREDISLELSLDPTIDPIRADSGQLEQVLLNLVVNAKDAMPTGGRLRIATSFWEEREGHKHGGGEAKDRFVVLEVADTGHGMTPEVKRKIFEPFFTTKDVGKGTGLGLSVVHGVVTQCGGRIHVTSELGIGTVFQLLFPVTVASEEVAVVVESRTPEINGAETILVVEDEEEVRNVVQTVLEASGYNVLLAESGVAALETFKTCQEKVHLLLTDVVMPEMCGKDLAREIHAIRPDVRTLFMSGHTTETISSLGVVDSRDAFLHKPFTPKQLLHRVRMHLGEHKDGTPAEKK